MKNLLLLACVAAAASAVPLQELAGLEACAFPNKTDVEFHVFNCDDSHPITVNSAQVLDRDTGKEIYPVDVRRPLIIKLKSTNNGHIIHSNKNDVELSEFSKSWTYHDCRWNRVPTFGLLNNIDGCDYAKNCPLAKGDIDLLLPLDLSKYSKILKFLTGNKAYQLRILMRNGEGDQKEELACVYAQLKFA